MKKAQKILTLALALLIIASLAACSAGSKNVISEESTYGTSVQNYDMAAPQDTVDAEKGSGFTSSTSLTAGQGEITVTPEKIIYSGTAEIETLKFDETLTNLNKLVEEYGGFFQSSSVTGSDYASYAYGAVRLRRAYYEIRIPSDKFATVTGLLETLGNVPYSSTNAENITMQDQDTEARLTAYRAQEERYLELLGKANTVEEVLSIEKYLTEVRYNIESLESQIKNWDSRIGYSTLTLNISEVAAYTEQKNPTLSYGEQLSATLRSSLKGIGSFFKSFFKFIVGALPVIVILAVIAVPILLIIRAHRRKKAAGSDKPQDRKE